MSYLAVVTVKVFLLLTVAVLVVPVVLAVALVMIPLLGLRALAALLTSR